MCGSAPYKPLFDIGNEKLVERTIRLLRENNISDIAISTNDERYDKIGVPLVHHENPTGDGYVWLNAFYPAAEETCYIYGDVLYSPEAIKTIVNTETEDIMFFASAPPFSPLYIKRWAEPFAYKVVDVDRFQKCIAKAKVLNAQGKFKRSPISWELWQVIKDTPLNHIDYTNYTIINDYTVDVDTAEQAIRILNRGDI